MHGTLRQMRQEKQESMVTLGLCLSTRGDAGMGKRRKMNSVCVSFQWLFLVSFQGLRRQLDCSTEIQLKVVNPIKWVELSQDSRVKQR